MIVGLDVQDGVSTSSAHSSVLIPGEQLLKVGKVRSTFKLGLSTVVSGWSRQRLHTLTIQL